MRPPLGVGNKWGDLWPRALMGDGTHNDENPKNCNSSNFILLLISTQNICWNHRSPLMQGRRSKEKPKCYYQRQLFILSEHTDGLSPAKSLCQIDAPYSAPLFTRIFKSILNPAYDRTIPFCFIPDTILLPL